ncbi:MAG: 4Fe-4S dicluster domain-containing protein [Syntrophobacteraceae bacterium]|nr:4Fe-4S dicluster domain-containing protein [Syntrophobacteraceae bacterium]
MDTSRRDFLKIGGLCALGLSSVEVAEAFAKSQASKYLTNPKAGAAKRWAMAIDVKKCWKAEKKECKDCILACDWAHNVPDIPVKRQEVKWLWNEKYENAFPDQESELEPVEVKEKPFLVLCNQCAHAPCVRVCPTQATFKNDQGITMMDMHRCIGCRYCMAACPYGARSFNWRDPRPYITKINPDYPTRDRGVVEKCDFCVERLAVGKIPACVEACKSKALIFGDLDDPNSDLRKALASRYSIRRKPELGTMPGVYYLM